ncbi:tetratricopeptide repeat protein [Flavobacterium sp.]|uniref:tetratricopeptide repeat protein n=1 Tax=Flavobacterium sp. TaxID=239 RepID=UPI003D6ABAC4
MTVAEYTYLLNKPDAVHDKQVSDLEKILDDFPYFQSARSLHLKGLFNQDSFKYNQALKSTASYTTDRTVLFDFITSKGFNSIQKKEFEEKEAQLLNIQVADDDAVSETASPILENTLEKSIISSINEAAQHEGEKIIIEKKEEESNSGLETSLVSENISENPVISSENEEEQNEEEAIIPEVIAFETESVEEKLEIGKPIPFENSETHSFQEWLQLAKAKPIAREENEEEEKKEDTNLASKLEIIDKFIEANPKISPVKSDATAPSFTIKTEDTSYLMTETLAKVYLEQKKYNKAIQAYEILILKYPEKITFFADRISDIKALQQNNNN